MKRLSIIFILLLLSLSAFSQTRLIIDKKNGSADSLKLSEIKDITFQLSGSISFPQGYYLYVANEGNGGGGATILKVLNNGSATVVGTGFNGPSGLAVHPVTRDLYISDDYSRIYRIQSNGTSTQIKGVFTNPNALAFDSKNRLLVAEAGGGISRVDLVTDSIKILATGFSIPQGVGEYNGNVFFTDASGYLFYIRESDHLPITAPAITNRYIASPVVPGTNGGLVVDNSGNIYIDDAQGKVVKVSGTDKSVTTVYNKPGTTRGLALSPVQDFLFVTLYNSQEILSINLNTMSSTVFSNSTISQGLLNGPFGMVITNTNFPNFVRSAVTK